MNILEDFFSYCAQGNFEKVKQIIQNETFNINTKNKNGWTGLIIVCFNSHIEIAAFLISKGANVNAVNGKGTSVFMYAKTPVLQNFKGINILNLLIHNGAKINHLDKFSKSVLDYVYELKNEELLKWLISKGAKYSREINN
jgi:ankyrin repeat protein